MKKTTMLILVLALVAAVTGCRRSVNREPGGGGKSGDAWVDGAPASERR